MREQHPEVGSAELRPYTLCRKRKPAYNDGADFVSGRYALTAAEQRRAKVPRSHLTAIARTIESVPKEIWLAEAMQRSRMSRAGETIGGQNPLAKYVAKSSYCQDGVEYKVRIDGTWEVHSDQPQTGSGHVGARTAKQRALAEWLPEIDLSEGIAKDALRAARAGGRDTGHEPEGQGQASATLRAASAPGQARAPATPLRGSASARDTAGQARPPATPLRGVAGVRASDRQSRTPAPPLRGDAGGRAPAGRSSGAAARRGTAARQAAIKNTKTKTRIKKRTKAAQPAPKTTRPEQPEGKRGNKESRLSLANRKEGVQTRQSVRDSSRVYDDKG